MSQFRTKIVTPLGQVFDADVASLSAPGEAGSFGVLYQHTPMITKLQKGVLTLKSENAKKYFIVSGGILEVDEIHNVMVLTDLAQEASTLEEAQDELKNKTIPD